MAPARPAPSSARPARSGYLRGERPSGGRRRGTDPAAPPRSRQEAGKAGGGAPPLPLGGRNDPGRGRLCRRGPGGGFGCRGFEGCWRSRGGEGIVPPLKGSARGSSLRGRSPALSREKPGSLRGRSPIPSGKKPGFLKGEKPGSFRRRCQRAVPRPAACGGVNVGREPSTHAYYYYFFCLFNSLSAARFS